MEKRVIHTDLAPAAIGPYSQAIESQRLVFTSGQIGLDPATGALVTGGFEAQVRQAFANLEAVLKACRCQHRQCAETDLVPDRSWPVCDRQLDHAGALFRAISGAFNQSGWRACRALLNSKLKRSPLSSLRCQADLLSGARASEKKPPRAHQTRRARLPRIRLASMGLVRAIDCVLHLPLRYEDETTVTTIEKLRPGAVGQIEARVVRSEVLYRGRRQLTVDVEDDSGALTLRFLHFYGSQIKHFETGRLLRIRGELRGGLFAREMIHPKYNVIKGQVPLPTSLTPVYPASDGVSQALLRAAVARAIESADLSDTLPQQMLDEAGLMPFEDAVRILHFPPPDVATGAAQ